MKANKIEKNKTSKHTLGCCFFSTNFHSFFLHFSIIAKQKLSFDYFWALKKIESIDIGVPLNLMDFFIVITFFLVILGKKLIDCETKAM